MRRKWAQEWNLTQQGGPQQIPQCVQVFIVAGHPFCRLICHPAGNLQAICAYRLGSEQRVINASQAHTHHQDHPQLQLPGNVRQGLPRTYGHPPATGALHQYEICAPQYYTAAQARQPLGLHAPTFLGRGNMGSYRRAQGHRVYLFIFQGLGHGRHQLQGIVIMALIVTSRGDRFYGRR